MQTVRDDRGRTYLLVRRSSESSLVRDPSTGDERYVESRRLEPVDDSVLETAATAVPEDVRRVLRVAGTDRSLGLLLELDRIGPAGVPALLESYDLCERDLHGLLAAFRVQGLVEETTVDGVSGYHVTDEAADALAVLRD